MDEVKQTKLSAQSIASKNEGCGLDCHDTSTALDSTSTVLCDGPVTGDTLKQLGYSLEKLAEVQKTVLLQLERINRRLLTLEEQSLLQTDFV
jgi:hypothetical protein